MNLCRFYDAKTHNDTIFPTLFKLEFILTTTPAPSPGNACTE